MEIRNIKKIKGLILLELENSGQFPIIEIFLICLNFVFINLILGINSISYIHSLDFLPNLREDFVNNLRFSLTFPLFLNGMLFVLLLNNSLINNSEKLIQQTLFSYPLSKSLYLSTKIAFYSIINLLFSLFFGIFYLLNSRIGLDLAILSLLLTILTINQMFATFFFLLIFLIFDNVLISNFVSFTVLSLKFMVFGQSNDNINLPGFMSPFFFPSKILTFFLNENILEIIYGLGFSFLITAILYIIVVERFRRKEMT